VTTRHFKVQLRRWELGIAWDVQSHTRLSPFVTDVTTETSRNNILSIAKEAFTKVITMLREHLSSKTSLGGRQILAATF
jgi:hypothetical protein